MHLQQCLIWPYNTIRSTYRPLSRGNATGPTQLELHPMEKVERLVVSSQCKEHSFLCLNPAATMGLHELNSWHKSKWIYVGRTGSRRGIVYDMHTCCQFCSLPYPICSPILLLPYSSSLFHLCATQQRSYLFLWVPLFLPGHNVGVGLHLHQQMLCCVLGFLWHFHDG